MDWGGYTHACWPLVIYLEAGGRLGSLPQDPVLLPEAQAFQGLFLFGIVCTSSHACLESPGLLTDSSLPLNNAGCVISWP